MNKHHQDCNSDGVENCYDFAKIHKAGPYSCSASWVESQPYWSQFLECMNDQVDITLVSVPCKLMTLSNNSKFDHVDFTAFLVRLRNTGTRRHQIPMAVATAVQMTLFGRNLLQQQGSTNLLQQSDPRRTRGCRHLFLTSRKERHIRIDMTRMMINNIDQLPTRTPDVLL